MSIRRVSFVCVVVLAFICAWTRPCSAQCLSDGLDGLCCQQATPSLPTFPSVSTGLKYICWDECDARINRDICLVLGSPQPLDLGSGPISGVYRISFTARSCGGGNRILWTGQLFAHYSRHWLESSVPGPSPDTGVWRFLLNGYFGPTPGVIGQYGNNTCAIPPCLSTFGTLYGQGYVDYARTCPSGQWTAAGTLYHGCDAEVHGPSSARPAPAAGFHTKSYSWVWPAAGFVPFSATEAGRRSEGAVEAGVVRLNQWSTRPGITRSAESVTSGVVQPTSERCNCTGASSLVPQYVVTQVSNGAAACGSIFQTSGAGLLQKRIGRWTAPTFPGSEYLLLDFGNMDHANACNGLATTEYFEGVETIGGFPAQTQGGVLLAPQFEDLASSNRPPLTAPQQTIGERHVSWYLLSLNVRAAYDVAWAVDADGFWDVASNWSTGVVPGPNDRVLIDRPAGNFTVTVRQPGAVAQGISSEEQLTITSGGELTVSGTVQVNNSFTLDGGKLASAMVLPGSSGQGLTVTTAVGPATLAGVTMDAGVSIPSGALLRVTGGLVLNGIVTNAATLEFFGGQTLSGSGQVVFAPGGGAKVVRPLGGTLTIGPGITIQGESGTVGQAGAAFVNQGTIRAAASGATMSLLGTSWSSTGTIHATNGGSLDLDGVGWTNAGALSITGGGTLDLSGTWTNTGSISMTASTVNLGGTFTTANVGSLSRTGGTVRLTGTLNNSALTLNATTGSWEVAGGSIVGGTVATSGGAELIAAGGTLDAITLNGSLSIPNGTSMTVTNGLTLNGTITLSSSGAGATLTFSGAQSLLGTGEIVLATSSSSNLVRPSLGTLTIGPSITIRGSAGTIGQPGIAFVNRGAIRAETSAQTIALTGTGWSSEGTLAATNNGRFTTAGTWSTSGTVSIPSGSLLTATGSYVQTAGLTTVDGSLSTTGSVDVQGGTLRGAGTINGNVTSAGSISPGTSAGTLGVSGTYAQQSAGALNVELGGTSLGSFDRLLASGAVTLDGTLNVSLIGGFQPAIGDQFIILTGSSVSGAFATTNGLDVGIGRQLRVDVNPTNVTLVVIRIFTIQWTVDSDGFWDDPSNWNPARVPNSTDNVLIDRPAGTFTITVRQGGAAAADVFSEERLAIVHTPGNPGTLTVSGQIQVNNSFTMNGGSLVNATVVPGSGGQGIDFLTSLGVATLNGVRIDCSLTIPANAFFFVRNGLVLNGDATITGFAGAIDFVGTQTLSGTGRVIMNANSTFAITTGTLTIGSGITITGAASTTGQIFPNGPASFVNFGTLLADQPGQTLAVNDTVANWSNQGTIVASNGGSVQLYGSNWTNAGSVTITGGGTLELGLQGAWTNTGTISMANSTVFLGGSFTLAALGNFTRSGGVVRLTGIFDNVTNLTLDATTGPWVIKSQDNNPVTATILGGTVTVTPAATLTGISGTLDGITLEGELIIANASVITVKHGLTLNGSILLTATSLGAGLEFSGTQSLVGTGEIVFNQGFGAVGATVGTLTIGPGVTLRGNANTSGQIFCVSASTPLVNQGTIRVTAPGQRLDFHAGPWTNEGTIEAANGGRIVIRELTGSWSNSGSVSIGSGSVLHIDVGSYRQTGGTTTLDGSLTMTSGQVLVDGGTLRGTGSIEASVVNGASVSPGASAGTLSITGAYTQQSGGALNVELGGTATSAFDRLSTGTATLDGTLSVSLINGFTPTLGQTFTILTSGSRAGSFATTSGLDLGGGLQLQVNYNPTNVTLEVVASP